MTAAIHQIVNHSQEDNLSNDITLQVLALENPEGYENYTKTSRRPRIGFTHMRYDYLPQGVKDGRAKVIHVSRNPLDVAVSYFHYSTHNRACGPYAGTWGEFFDAFIQGNVWWGGWYEYMTSWLKQRNQSQSNILFIKYEDFLEDPQKIIYDLSVFLGMEQTDDVINKISERVSFKSFQKNQQLKIINSYINKEKFLRKGTIGDWVHYFTPEQEHKISMFCKKFQDETGVVFRYK